MIGVKPLCCTDSEVALKYFQQKYKMKCCTSHFEIVFTDIQMPKIDGYKLAQCIRATETSFRESELKRGNLKVEKPCLIVAITGNYDMDEETMNKYSQAQIQEVLHKPAPTI